MTQQERNRKFYQDHKEEQKARVLEYYHTIRKHKIDREKRKKYMKEYQRTHPRTVTEAQRVEKNRRRRELYQEQPARRVKARAIAKQWQKDNPEKRKAQRLNRYKMTVADFTAMLEAQGDCCAICYEPSNGDKRLFPVVDHSHSTGQVRGILCANCNTGLGYFEDNPELLRRAAVYLSNSSSGATSTPNKTQ